MCILCLISTPDRQQLKDDFKNYFICLTCRERDRQRSPILWFTHQMPAMVRGGPDHSHEPGSQARALWVAGTNSLSHHLLPPKVHTSRKLKLGGDLGLELRPPKGGRLWAPRGFCPAARSTHARHGFCRSLVKSRMFSL